MEFFLIKFRQLFVREYKPASLPTNAAFQTPKIPEIWRLAYGLPVYFIQRQFQVRLLYSVMVYVGCRDHCPNYIW